MNSVFFHEFPAFGLDSCFLGLNLLTLGLKTLFFGCQSLRSAEELKFPRACELVVVARHRQPIFEVGIFGIASDLPLFARGWIHH